MKSPALFYYLQDAQYIRSEVKKLFQVDPWTGEGPDGQGAKMAFMSAYNMDKFKDFVFKTSFLKRYRISSNLLAKAEKDDCELLKIGLAWIEVFVWKKPSNIIKPKR